MDKRPIREEEINLILSKIPKPPGTGKRAVELAHKQNLKTLYNSLKGILINDDKQSFEKFSQAIVNKMIQSYVIKHIPVGLVAAQTIGQSRTQASLHAKRGAGARADRGAENYNNLLSGSSNITPLSIIFFKDKANSGEHCNDILHYGTLEDMLAKRAAMESTYVSDVIDFSKTKMLIGQEAINEEGIPELLDMHYSLYNSNFASVPKEAFLLTHVLRLEIIPYKCYTHRITMDMIAQTIMKEEKNLKSIVCLWKSQREGFLYILANKTCAINEIFVGEEKYAMYLKISVTEMIKENIIKGFPGLYDLEPRFAPITQIIKRVDHDEEFTYIITNNVLSRLSGISHKDLMFTLHNKQINVLEIFNKDGEIFFKIPLTKNIKDILSEDGFYYLIAYGWNDDQLIWEEDVDLTRLIITHPHIMNFKFGICTSYQYALNDLLGRLFTGTFDMQKNPSHLSLHFLNMTFNGVFGKTTSGGLAMDGKNKISLATIEQGYKNVTQTAGAIIPNNDLSSAILSGTLPPFGTALVNIESNFSFVPPESKEQGEKVKELHERLKGMISQRTGQTKSLEKEKQDDKIVAYSLWYRLKTFIKKHNIQSTDLERLIIAKLYNANIQQIFPERNNEDVWTEFSNEPFDIPKLELSKSVYGEFPLSNWTYGNNSRKLKEALLKATFVRYLSLPLMTQIMINNYGFRNWLFIPNDMKLENNKEVPLIPLNGENPLSVTFNDNSSWFVYFPNVPFIINAIIKLIQVNLKSLFLDFLILTYNKIDPNVFGDYLKQTYNFNVNNRNYTLLYVSSKEFLYSNTEEMLTLIANTFSGQFISNIVRPVDIRIPIINPLPLPPLSSKNISQISRPAILGNTNIPSLPF